MKNICSMYDFTTGLHMKSVEHCFHLSNYAFPFACPELLKILIILFLLHLVSVQN